MGGQSTGSNGIGLIFCTGYMLKAGENKVLGIVCAGIYWRLRQLMERRYLLEDKVVLKIQ